MKELLASTVEAYKENIKLILFFSLPFLLAFPLSLLLPSFVSLGGTFLRFASLPVDLNFVDIAILAVAFLVSLFLVCFALVNITMLVRSQRTLVGIRQEYLRAMGHYTWRVFWSFLGITLLILLINMFLYDFGAHTIQGSLIAFVLWLPLFYVPQAVVIDELSPFKAMAASIRKIMEKPLYFVFWLLIGIILISLIDAIALATGIFEARYVVLALNAIFIIPFLVVMQAQIYMRKFALAK